MAISTNQLYTPSPPTIAPQGEDARNLADWMQRELFTISQTLSAITRLQLAPVAAAPTTPRTGLVAMNDGTNWNPLSFTTGSKQTLLTYRSGQWVQCDLGLGGHIDDNQFGGFQSFAINAPDWAFTNINNDPSGPQLTFNKARSGTPTFNTSSGDQLAEIFAAGFANAAFQQTAALLITQDGASVGSKVPSKFQFFTSDTTSGPFNRIFVMDSGGNFSAPGNAVIGSFLVAGSGAAIGITDNYTGTSGSINASVPFHTFTPSGVYTATLTAANALAPGLLQFFQNRTANAINSASSNVKPIGSNTAGTAILPGTIGAWCILINDASTNTWLTVARGT